MRFLLALLLSIGAIVTSSHVVPSGSQYAAPETGSTETHAPNQSHDDTWQPAARVATTTDSHSQFRTLHARAVTAITYRAPFPQLPEHIGERVDAARDRSPQHPIPLLI